MLIISLPAWINAQVQEQLSPTEKRFQSVVTEPLTIYKGFFRAGESVSFSLIDKIFDARRKKVLVESNALGRIWTFSTFLQYGISDRLQAEIQIPYQGQSLTLSSVYEFQNPDTSYVSRHSNPTKGLGDLNLTFVYQLVHGSYTKPFLGLYVTANIPTGEKNPTRVSATNPQEYNHAPGTGAFSFETSLRFRKISFPYSYDLNVKYKNNLPGKKLFHPSDPQELNFKTGNKVNVSASVNVHLNNWVILKNVVDFSSFGRGNIDGKKGDTSWQISLYPGLIFQIKGFRIATTIAYPLAGKSTGADPFYVMILQYTF